jgi:hypothetical protein
MIDGALEEPADRATLADRTVSQLVRGFGGEREPKTQ